MVNKLLHVRNPLPRPSPHILKIPTVRGNNLRRLQHKSRRILAPHYHRELLPEYHRSNRRGVLLRDESDVPVHVPEERLASQGLVEEDPAFQPHLPLPLLELVEVGPEDVMEFPLGGEAVIAALLQYLLQKITDSPLPAQDVGLLHRRRSRREGPELCHEGLGASFPRSILLPLALHELEKKPRVRSLEVPRPPLDDERNEALLQQPLQHRVHRGLVRTGLPHQRGRRAAPQTQESKVELLLGRGQPEIAERGLHCGRYASRA